LKKQGPSMLRRKKGGERAKRKNKRAGETNARTNKTQKPDQVAALGLGGHIACKAG